MRSTSEGDLVPGCQPSDGSFSTPNAGSPGPRAAKDGSVEEVRTFGEKDTLRIDDRRTVVVAAEQCARRARLDARVALPQ
jgi:hypothetical protein